MSSLQMADIIHRIACSIINVKGFESICYKIPNKIIICVSSQKVSRDIMEIIKPFTSSEAFTIEFIVDNKGI